jgi:dTDP-glucose 4,6-dehydratase
MKIIITGGCGFIGHHLVEHIYKNTDWNIIILDKLSYASNGFERLRDINIIQDVSRLKIFTIDLSQPISVGIALEIGKDVNYIIHLAADTHVDNSIKEPVPFIQNNIMSTVYFLEYARTLPFLRKFFYFSTDEVFGPAPVGVSYKEWDRHKPTNPYSASKAASEDICISYENTYKLPIIILNSMNVFGERQHVEKFIPKVIKCIKENRLVEIHCDKECKIPGSRYYIHARNVASAIMFLVEYGTIGEKYNIMGEKEVDNLEMAQFISKIMGIPLRYSLINFHSERPGHDLRYCLDGNKLFSLGWKIPVQFETSLEKTIKWTLQNQKWIE